MKGQVFLLWIKFGVLLRPLDTFSNYSHTGIVLCQHDKRVSVMTDAPKKWCSKAVVTMPRYSYLHLHSGTVNIGMQNLTSRPVVIKPKTTIAAILAANVVPPMLSPRVNIKSTYAESSDSALSEINLILISQFLGLNQSYLQRSWRNFQKGRPKCHSYLV